jgi:hypothetical protein
LKRAAFRDNLGDMVTLKHCAQMSEIKKNIIHLLDNNPGLSDRELTDAIQGRQISPQYMNQNCRYLESRGILLRKKREDGRIGNWLYKSDNTNPFFSLSETAPQADEISEKKIKQVLGNYLTSQGWHAEISWGTRHGVDIQARRGNVRWIIEVKGSGAYNPMRLNFFHSVLGEILQRMDEPSYKYSIALPDMETFRRLWERLPALARARLGITALFVNLTGSVAEIA